MEKEGVRGAAESSLHALSSAAGDLMIKLCISSNNSFWHFSYELKTMF